MAVVIPRDVLSKAGVREGDVLKLAVPVSIATRKRVWKKFAGIDRGRPAFSREGRDPVDGW